MKNFLTIFLVFTTASIYAQEDLNWRIIPSLTDWIEEINNSEDSTYIASYIKVLLDPIKDKDYIILDEDAIRDSTLDQVNRLEIRKPIQLSNIQFGDDTRLFEGTCIKNLHFLEDVSIYYLINSRIALKNVVFENLYQNRLSKTLFWIAYFDCTFNGFFQTNNPQERTDINFVRCEFEDRVYISSGFTTPSIFMINSVAKHDFIFADKSNFNSIKITECQFDSILDFSEMNILNDLLITKSSLKGILIDGTNLPVSNTYLPFDQISRKVKVKNNNVEDWLSPEGNEQYYYVGTKRNDFKSKDNLNRLIASYSKLLGIYKARSEMESYNACYIEMREKQTAQSKYIYEESPTFSNFMVYQLNRFMGTFSDYGTKPTKAILVSVYVIFFFAFIYLFFPNSWDSHGKKRIVDRFSFFLKYMNQKAGIHEVYLEEKKKDIMEYDDFKNLISHSENKVPKFFTAAALPMYKWAISGTELSARILKNVDIMKGSWRELPENKRWWKSILLIGAFVIAVLYDLFIKILNALMLSINTFTTLGFGEIPIKGLPRYLAIIQGFIGWFMLTIFSVSLISQLLN